LKEGMDKNSTLSDLTKKKIDIFAKKKKDLWKKCATITKIANNAHLKEEKTFRNLFYVDNFHFCSSYEVFGKSRTKR
jgi:hypothetical protein